MTKVASDFNTKVGAKLATMLDGNTYCPTRVQASAKSIQGRGATLDIDIHATAVACIHTSMDHRDTGSAVRLVNAMPKGSRVKSLVQWFDKFSNIRLTVDNKTGAYVGKMLKADHKEYAAPDTVKALATPFWTPAEIVKAGAFDDIQFAAAVAKLIKRASDDNAQLSPAGIAALADLRVLSVKVAPKAEANA